VLRINIKGEKMKIPIFNIGTLISPMRKEDVIRKMNDFKNTDIESRSVLFSKKGFNPTDCIGQLNISNKEDIYKIRIEPEYTSGISIFGILKLEIDKSNTTNIQASIDLGIALKIVLIFLITIFPAIFISMALSMDHYNQIINGIAQIVHKKPYCVIYMIIGFIVIWYGMTFILINQYKKKIAYFCEYSFNAKRIN
jgi:hypothetical protein